MSAENLPDDTDESVSRRRLPRSVEVMSAGVSSWIFFVEILH